MPILFRLWTGFYVDRDQIFGPERSGHYYIRDRRIYGPICTPGQLAPNIWSFDAPPPSLAGAGPVASGEHYFYKGRIFGPRANGNFYIKSNHIYGPPGLWLPWLDDGTQDGTPPIVAPRPKWRKPNQRREVIRPLAA